MKTYQKLLLTVLALILIAVLLAVMFWDTIALYAMPGTVAAEAVSNAYEQLRQRFADDPLLLLPEYVDPEGRQAADISLTAADPILGNIGYDMRVQLQPHSFHADGAVTTGGQSLDLSLYLNTDFMAVASEDLVQGSYYGITYDTFAQDIRSIPLLSWMIGESVLQKWNDRVLQVQSRMLQEHSLPRIPQMSDSDVQKIILALAALPAKGEKTTVSVQGELLDCHRITYTLSGQLLGQVIALDDPESASLKAAFYLKEKNLVLAEVLFSTGLMRRHIQLELGADIRRDPLKISVLNEIQNETQTYTVTADTQQEQGLFRETWTLQKNGQAASTWSYDWNPETGKLMLSVNEAAAFAVTLSETEAGLCLRSENISDIFRALTGQQDGFSTPLSGSVTFRRGTELTPPQYKNLNQWSMEDFLILLEGIGALIGLEFT